MKVELVTRSSGVGKYEGLTNEEILSAIARHGVIKEDKGRLVKYLMSEKHWSPLDMINFGFEVETSRAIGRQWLRHKSLCPQEHSQRYSDKVSFENIELRLEHPTNRQSSTDVIGMISGESKSLIGVNLDFSKDFDNQRLRNDVMIKIGTLLQEIEETYKQGIDLGIAKECMRSILPECTTSVLTFNGTLRSWLSFLNVRCDHHTQKELVKLATLVGESLEVEMPQVFSKIDWRNGMFM